MKVGFIGCGNIAAAIISGAVGAKYLNPVEVFCYNPHPEKAVALQQQYGVRVLQSATEVAGVAEVLFLTVKPQKYAQVIAEIKNSVLKSVCMVDVAAGVQIKTVQQLFGFPCAVVRAMPNTPLLVGQGATALAAGSEVSKACFEFVFGIFSAAGLACRVAEENMDAVTGISGSAPAFFMRFAREIITCGVQNGMDPAAAEQLVVQTLRGTAELLTKNPGAVNTLIKNVASPGGTTEAGLKQMDALDFDAKTNAIIQAAITRSAELAKN